MVQPMFKMPKNSSYKALYCILLVGLMILFNSFLVSSESVGIYNYNFSNITNNTAYWGQPTSSNMWSFSNNATQEEYDNLKYEDGLLTNNTMIVGTSNDYPFYRFNFTITENKSLISKINVKFTGYDNATEVGTIYVWRFANATWMPIGTTPATRGNVTRNFTSDISNYIDANNQFVIIWEGSAYDQGDAVLIDYVGLDTYIDLIENSRNYSSSITEGLIGTFILNVSTLNPVTSATLYYNGTAQSTTISTGEFTTITSSFQIPQVTSTTNVSFYWVVNYSGGSTTTSSSNQTIFNFNIDNCAINKLPILNFTMYDEITQYKLNGTGNLTNGKLNMQIYPFNNRNIFYSYNSTFNNTNPFAVCINSSLFTDEKYSFDLELEYSGTDYQTEFYHLQNETLQNSYYNTNISLYSLLTANAKVFKLNYKDNSYNPVGDALILIKRKYIGEGVFKTSEIPITDYNGQTTASLQESNVVYSFYVYKYGYLLDSFENVFVQCQYSSLDQCSLDLNSPVTQIIIENYSTGNDINYILYYPAWRTIAVNFSIPSGTSSTITLNATLFDNLGNTSACSTSILSTSGTLSCAVSSGLGNSSVEIYLYKDGTLVESGIFVIQPSPDDIYGNNRVFLLLLVYLLFIGIGVSMGEPNKAGIMIIIGAILGGVLNLVYVHSYIGTGATILLLIIAVILLLTKGAKRT